MPPTIDPAAISPATAQSTSAAKTKITPAVRLTSPGEDVLEPVEALQVVVDRDPEDPDQEDALAGAEVAAVDAARRDGRSRGEAALVLGPAAVGECPVDPRLRDDEDQRDRDQHRDDRLERRGGEDEQQGRADDAADDRADRRA